MAAVLLFWDTNMAAVTSCENTLFLCKRGGVGGFRGIYSFPGFPRPNLVTQDGGSADQYCMNYL